MRRIPCNLGIMLVIFLFVGCGSQPHDHGAKEAPSMPPQDSGAGKNMKGRIPPQPGKAPANK